MSAISPASNSSYLSTLSSTESRALKLLGDGFAPEQVASAIGVSPSRISQLLSDENFSQEVANLRYQNLAAHTDRDSRYDKLEDKLLQKLEASLSMLFDPMKIAKLLQVINGAKRRGVSSQEQIQTAQTVVQLNMPTQIFQKFVTNVNNQVIQAGSQELITVQSGKMAELLAASRAPALNLLSDIMSPHQNSSQTGDQNVQNAISTTPETSHSSV